MPQRTEQHAGSVTYIDHALLFNVDVSRRKLIHIT